MSERWRYACPKGHRAVRSAGHGMNSPLPSGSVYCHTCMTSYPAREIRDMKREHDA